ncbi:hypothetical protein [Dyella flagellata]|uniref:hypothetical protein n=1 Tax=Dyella flagellata TaxID=1867833 RepID=UPI0024E1531D|nr:hypothetical protein [Dyella flagellata]
MRFLFALPVACDALPPSAAEGDLDTQTRLIRSQRHAAEFWLSAVPARNSDGYNVFLRQLSAYFGKGFDSLSKWHVCLRPLGVIDFGNFGINHY